MPSRRSRDSLKRRRPRLEPRPLLLVCCEGEVTEPCYFKALKNEERNRLVKVVVYPGGATPKTLVEKAIEKKREAEHEARRQKDDYLRYNEVWCVFDVDQHPNIPDAKQQARDNGIKLAISNPCFELWALLHFQDQRAYIDRGAVQGACRTCMPGYQKELPYERLRPFHAHAVDRATTLDLQQASAANDGGNPSTSVYRLTERMRELGKAAQLKKQIDQTGRR
jgi:RloB-like protein